MPVNIYIYVKTTQGSVCFYFYTLIPAACFVFQKMHNPESILLKDYVFPYRFWDGKSNSIRVYVFIYNLHTWMSTVVLCLTLSVSEYMHINGNVLITNI